MKRIQGCCLRTVEEQKAGGDDNPIDPETIEFNDFVSLTVGYTGPVLSGGTVKLFEGRLWFEGDLPDEYPTEGFLAISYLTDGNRVVLDEVSIIDNPVDKGALPFSILSE